MTTPVSADVGHWLKPMGYPVVELLFFRVHVLIRFGYTLCNHFFVALLVTSVFAVRTLVPSGVLEEISAECTTHDVIELLLDKFVPIHFMNLLFTLTNSTLASKSEIQRPLVLVKFHYATQSVVELILDIR